MTVVGEEMFQGYFGAMIQVGIRMFNRWTPILETRIDPVEAQNVLSQYRPIFIVGAPRSGSTLLYQTMVRTYRLGYLTNLHCLLFGAPCWLEQRLHLNERGTVTDYKSHYGRTSGLLAPAECGDFWYRFFRRRPQFIPRHEVNEPMMRALRVTVASFVNSCAKPVVFKNLINSVRLYPLAQVFPEALFIVIQRDVVDNAHSLLAVRKAVTGNYHNWWSLEPPGIEFLRKLPAHEQVVEQVLRTYQLIEECADRIGSGRFETVEYEAFCKDTYGTLTRLDRFFAKNGLNLCHRQVVPAAFEMPAGIRIDQGMYEKMNTYAKKRTLRRHGSFGE